MRAFQTAAATASPMPAPTDDQRPSTAMARATSWCGTDACEPTCEPTTEKDPPMPCNVRDERERQHPAASKGEVRTVKTCDMTRRAVSCTPLGSTRRP